MQKFQDLLTEAAQLKEQQLKQERKNFQALPQYLKAGLNFARKYIPLRKQHYLLQKYVCEKLKAEGNEQYLLKNYTEALSKYQEALSIFRYIHASKYENLKDEDIIYQSYTPDSIFENEHRQLLIALYLNICSALTKINKKDQALHAADEAFKLDQQNSEPNPKIYYKRAQAHLHYINKDNKDIKLGFYYLNKCYEISKDQGVLMQMHKIKKELEEEREKEKNWFKFMFEKNKATGSQIKTNENEKQTTPQKDSVPAIQTAITKVKEKQNVQKIPEQKNNYSKALENFLKDENQRKEKGQQKDEQQSELSKFERTKQSLRKYLKIYQEHPCSKLWLIKFQQDFIHKYGSKIYSILQLYNYKQYLLEFKCLLAKCLQLRQIPIPQYPREEAVELKKNEDLLQQPAKTDPTDNKTTEEKIRQYQIFIEWLRMHPVEQYRKYIQRYDLQRNWLIQNRPAFQKQELNLQPQACKLQNQTKSKKTNKQQAVKNTVTNKISPRQSKSQSFKQQWQEDLQNQQKNQKAKSGRREQVGVVPQSVKAFLENYEDSTTSLQKQQHDNMKKDEIKTYRQGGQKSDWEKQNKQEKQQDLKPKQSPQNILTHIKTFGILFIMTLLLKWLVL